MKNQSILIVMLLQALRIAAQDVSAPMCRISLGPDRSVCNDDSLRLFVEGDFVAYNWSEGSDTQAIYAHAGDTIILQVTDSAGCVASDTVIIRKAAPCIRGYIMDTAGNPFVGATVSLLRMNKEDTTLQRVDSVHTDTLGRYVFQADTGSWFVRTLPFEGGMPVYYDDACMLQSAMPVQLTHCDTLEANIKIKPVLIGAGQHNVGGKVYKGGKPYAGLRLILLDGQGRACGFAISKKNGSFRFEQLRSGLYKIRADRPYIASGTEVDILLSDELPEKNDLRICIHAGHMEIANYTCKGVKDALHLPYTVYSLVLNSLRYNDKGNSLLMQGTSVALMPEIGALDKLENLELSFNQITDLPASLGKLSCLQTLILTGNKLRDLPASLSALKSLKTLNLKDNLLEEIPSVVWEMNSLQTLILRINKISVLPAEINRLSQLKVLDLAGNFGLSELPGAITSLHKLEKLKLESCSSLKDLPEGISRMKQLKYINLSYTKISPKKVEALRKALPECKIKFEKK